MAIVVLKLPDVKREKEERPQRCPYCRGETFQRWGQVQKPVKDVHVRQVWVYRYRCCGCHRTFRHYPEGNTRADQTERLRSLAVVLWTLGLSHRSASLILGSLKVAISFMTIWRNVQAEAQIQKKHNQWRPVRVVGLDGAYVLGWGEKDPCWWRSIWERENLLRLGMSTNMIRTPFNAGWCLWCNDMASR